MLASQKSSSSSSSSSCPSSENKENNKENKEDKEIIKSNCCLKPVKFLKRINKGIQGQHHKVGVGSCDQAHIFIEIKYANLNSNMQIFKYISLNSKGIKCLKKFKFSTYDQLVTSIQQEKIFLQRHHNLGSKGLSKPNRVENS